MSNNIGDKNLYLYDIVGNTVGVKKGTAAAEQALSEGKKEYSTTEVNGETYILFEKPRERYGTMDLTLRVNNPHVFDTYFMQGDLTAEQFKTAMEQIGIKDVQITTEGNKTKITYTDKPDFYSNKSKQVTLYCTTEACASQTDNKRVSNFVVPPSILTESEINQYYEAVGYEDGKAKYYIFKPGVTEAQVQAAVNKKLNPSGTSSTSSTSTSTTTKTTYTSKTTATTTKTSSGSSKVSLPYMYVLRGDEVLNVVPNPNNKYNWKEQLQVKQGSGFVYNQDEIYNKGNLSLDAGRQQAVTIEQLTVQQIMDILSGKYSSYIDGIPTSELQKWANAHKNEISGFNISNKTPSGYDHEEQFVKFTYQGKTYEYHNPSYETKCSYEYSLDSSDGPTNHLTSVIRDQGKIEVSSAQQLKQVMTSNPDSIIFLTNDIDMSGIDWTPIEEFSGAICGQGHTIKNLTVTTDKENAGFVGTLTGIIRDVNFENAKIVNNSGEVTSSSGVIAGKMEVKRTHQKEVTFFNGKTSLSGGYETRIINVFVKNSTVTGGANTGAMVGNAVNSDKTDYNSHIKDCNVTGCTIKGSYANGGALGHTDAINITTTFENYNGKKAGTVSDTKVEGGTFAGGVIGSADNEVYTRGYWDGGTGEGYTNTGEQTAYMRAEVTAKNVTVEGEEGETLAAGGVYGRMDAPDKTTYKTQVDASTVSTSHGTNVTSGNKVSGAYAEGTVVGWCCEVDPETGKVTKDCDAPFDSREGEVGRAGTTTDEVMKSHFDQNYNLQEKYAEIDRFAAANNLTRWKNFRHVYQDSSGQLYWQQGDTLMCDAYENSIDAFKIWTEQSNRGAQATVHIDGEYDLDTYLLMAMVGNFDPVTGPKWEVDYLLEELGAVDVYRNGFPREYDSDGNAIVRETYGEIYYTTSDGSWHKLTASDFGTARRDGGRDKEDSLAATGVSSAAEYVQLHMVTDKSELDGQMKQYYTETLTAEEVMKDAGALVGQPPHNQGFVKDGIDGYVEEVKVTKESYLSGVALDRNPENATLQDYKDMLVMTNFLKADIESGTNVNVSYGQTNGKWILGKYQLPEEKQIPIAWDENGNPTSWQTAEPKYKGEFCNDPEGKYKMTHAINCHVSMYDDNYFQVGAQYADENGVYIDWKFIKDGSSSVTHTDSWSTVGGSVELTAENFDLLKNSITLYDKDQMVEKVIEKLMNESWKIVGEDKSRTNDGSSNYSTWVSKLIDAIGGEKFRWTGGVDGKYMGLINMGYAHAEFDLNGHHYCIPFASNAQVYDEKQIFTKEDVEALRPYLSDEIINDTFYNMKPTASRGSCFFNPLLSVDGKIVSWLYIGNLDGMMMLHYGAGANELNRGCIPYDIMRSSNPQDVVEYIQTHDMVAIKERNKAMNTQNEDGTVGSNGDWDPSVIDWTYEYVKSKFGLSDEVMDYYFHWYYGDNDNNRHIYVEDNYSVLKMNYDADMNLPRFKNLTEFTAYASTHNLTEEYNAALEVKAEIVAQRAEETAKVKAATAKKERESHSEEFIEKFVKQFVGYDAAISEFNSVVAEYKTKYINDELSKVNFDGLVYKAYETIKTKYLGNDEETPRVIMTAAEYKAKVNQYVNAYGLVYDKSADAYMRKDDYKPTYFLYNPFADEGKEAVSWYPQGYLTINNDWKEYQTGTIYRKQLIMKIKAALAQNLNFTSDPNICMDNNNNVYKYDEATNTYKLKK